MSFKRPESILVIVYTCDGQVLLLQRKDWPDFWQSVTGSIELGEAAAVAALRELYEETGLEEKSGKLIDCQHGQWFTIYEAYLHRYAPGVTQNYEQVFLFELPAICAVQISPHEHTQYQWVSKEEAMQLAFSETNRLAISQWVGGEK